MKRIIMTATIAIVVMGTLAGNAFAQSTTDPAIAKAKEETVVVYDLGRMFGYLNAMVKDGKTPALSADQLKKLYDIAKELESTKRVEPSRAKILLTQIEDKIITPAQLMAADKLAAAKETERTSTQGTGPGATGGTSPLAAYVAGGNFNPMLDKTKTMGKDFFAFLDYVSKKAGK